jgi:hypothetical protein
LNIQKNPFAFAKGFIIKNEENNLEDISSSKLHIPRAKYRIIIDKCLAIIQQVEVTIVIQSIGWSRSTCRCSQYIVIV